MYVRGPYARPIGPAAEAERLDEFAMFLMLQGVSSFLLELIFPLKRFREKGVKGETAEITPRERDSSR